MSDREHDCPKCGGTTTIYGPDEHAAVGGRHDFRDCDNDGCNWCVIISGPTIT